MYYGNADNQNLINFLKITSNSKGSLLKKTANKKGDLIPGKIGEIDPIKTNKAKLLKEIKKKHKKQKR